MKEVQLFQAMRAFWFLKKLHSSKNCVSGNVLMIPLTQNSPTCTYIGYNQHNWKPHKWKPHYVGTKCKQKNPHFLLFSLQGRCTKIEMASLLSCKQAKQFFHFTGSNRSKLCEQDIGLFYQTPRWGTWPKEIISQLIIYSKN